MLFPTTMYRICGVDPEKAGKAWDRIPELMEEAEKRGRRFPRKKPIVRPQPNPIEWRANLTQIRNPDGSPVSGIDAEQLSYGEVEGRRQCWDTFEFIKSVTPGFERAYIVEIAPQIGIRETRRVRGEYMLTRGRRARLRRLPRRHRRQRLAGRGARRRQRRFPSSRAGERGFNQLPYRMIVPQKIDNLLVAGRCASMTHGGQSAARVSGPCFVMGQAAGTAAHLSLQSGTPPRQLDVQSAAGNLERDGAYLGREAAALQA